ncbi:hypothetical protein GCM10027422_42640 [Hymenobacter arcticus]
MKKLLTVASTLALTAGLLTAHSQAPATAPAKPTKTPEQRAATYQGPKVVTDSKALGKKMVQKSKPTDMRMPPPAPVQVK